MSVEGRAGSATGTNTDGAAPAATFSTVIDAGFAITMLLAQVTEGQVEVVNVRETDGRLGPLVVTLTTLGVIALAATAAFWWATRPRHTPTRTRSTPDG